MELSIEKSLVLSTCTLKFETFDSLDYPHPNQTIRSAVHEYGGLIFVSLGKDEEGIKKENDYFNESGMEELIPIMALARKSECTLINFDRDATSFANLQEFDW